MKYLIKKNWKQAIWLLSLALVLIWAMPADAQGLPWRPLVPCDTEDNPVPCQLCHFWWLASNIINFLVFEIATPITILLFLAAGFVYIASAGNPNRIEMAKKIFLNTVIGIFIVYASWLVVSTVINTVAADEFTAAWEWNRLPDCPGTKSGD